MRGAIGLPPKPLEMLAPHLAVCLVNDWPALWTIAAAEVCDAVEIIARPLGFDELEQYQRALEDEPGPHPPGDVRRSGELALGPIAGGGVVA